MAKTIAQICSTKLRRKSMDKESIIKVLDLLGKKYHVNSSKPFIISQCLFDWNHRFGDRSPSFGIKIDEDEDSTCKCYTCHKSIISLVDAIDILNQKKNNKYEHVLKFASELENRDFNSKISKTIKNYKDSVSPKKKNFTEDIIIPEKSLDDFKNYYHPYAISRKIDKSTYKFWELSIDERRNRLVFPIRRESDGALVGATARTLVDQRPKYLHYWNIKKSHFFYGEHLFNPQNKTIVLVEGTIDVVKCWQFYSKTNEYIFLATLGSSISQVQAMRLMEKNLPTVLLYDSDDAGLECVDVAKHYLKKHVPLYVAKLEEDLDPGDPSIKFEDINNAIKQSKFVM